ncbi:MAG: alpha/beta fold hydrolase [Saprospiraceae bacterium]
MQPKSLSLIMLLILSSLLVSSCFKKDLSVAKLKSKYTNGESQFTMIEGMNVHYRDEGNERAPCILFLHDTGSSLHSYEKWADTLKLSYRVLRLDLPGFGLTGPHPSRDYSMKMYRDFLDIFLADMGAKKCYVVGTGLGGRLAWELTLAYPKRVRRMVLIGAMGFPLDKKHQTPLEKIAKGSSTSKLYFKKFTPKKAIKRTVYQNHSDEKSVTKEQIDRQSDLLRRKGNRKAFIDRMAQEDYNRTRRLRDIEIPVLLAWGTDDKIVPIDHASYFHKLFPNSKVKMYPKMGHLISEEKNGKPIIDLMDFLDYRK